MSTLTNETEVIKPKTTPSTNVLYRFFDRSGGLLYIGITCNPPSRFKQHGVTKDWWENVANINIETFPDRQNLEKAEREAIQAEKPRFNIVHNRDKAEQVEKPEPTYPSHPLVGKFFHTTRRCSHGAVVAEKQGYVTSYADGYLVIELFDWWMGDPSGERLVKVSDLADQSVIFYPDGESMRFSCEHGSLSHMKRCKELN